MLKVCPNCRETFAGGRACPDCGPDALLLDVADPATQALLPELNLARPIRRFYAARRALIQFFVGLTFGVATGLLLFRHGVGVGGEAGFLWKVGGIIGGLAVMAVFVVAGTIHARRHASRDREI
ncbi:MAG: hypothetical protein HYY84_14670 [Deltaproteobacteria bacterium]|nr:hypothetical protein [Deltaproteobacteria bacterium]